ncbi:MAG: hypothetical protein KatS3mg042_0051 [Rhodothermaceae bacterium]|nr:MAG: hypothetical protein KatS3mg042_0051 [Rhodothermaceae bacterium]
MLRLSGLLLLLLLGSPAGLSSGQSFAPGAVSCTPRGGADRRPFPGVAGPSPSGSLPGCNRASAGTPSGETLSFPGALKPPAPDRWLAFDKAQHLTFSFLGTLSSQYVLVNKAGWAERDALPASISMTAALGLGKELYDWRFGTRRQFSYRDLVADALGIALAAGLIVL